MKSALLVGGLVVVATIAVVGVSAVTTVVTQDQAADQARRREPVVQRDARPDHQRARPAAARPTRPSSPASSAATSR